MGYRLLEGRGNGIGSELDGVIRVQKGNWKRGKPEMKSCGGSEIKQS